MLAVSAATFLVYAADKSAAQRGRWRVSERTLHLWSLLGGWPGAFLAQRVLRHKTRKEEFLSGYRRTVAAQCDLLTLGVLLTGMNFGGSDEQTWPIATIFGSDVADGSGLGWWEAAAGALAGAASMAALRMPRMAFFCLALLACGAVVVLAAAAIDGTMMIFGRVFAAAGSHPVGLVCAVAGQCTVALLGAGPCEARLD